MVIEKIHTPILFIAVASGEEEILFHQEWLTMAARQPSFRHCPIEAGQNDSDAVGKTLTMLAPLLTGQSNVIPMLCGTKAFVHPLRVYFTERGYDRKDETIETYD